MKTLLLTIFLLWVTGYAAQASYFPQPHHYVVIGAFAIKKNAEHFALNASWNNLTARFEINPNRNLYYVYVLLTDDRQEAIREAIRLRTTTSYHDAWVYKGILGTTQAQRNGEDIHPVTQLHTERINIADVAFVYSVAEGTLSASGNVNKIAQPDLPEESAPQVQDEQKHVTSLGQIKTGAEIKYTESALPSRQVVFSLYRADNQMPIAGDVLVIDLERSRKLGSFESNRPVRLNHPGNQSGEVFLLTEVFGYRKVQKVFRFNHTAPADVETDIEGNIVIPFEMVRLQKGDIAVMYNVYFFKDAAIMRPESQWEMKSLLEMLKENPNYKIKIHGHTNGNAPGKIISRSSNSDSFFSLTNTREGFGSAKKLSQARAEAIKEYLMANGIDAQRMQIKAWGGKRPVVDKLHSLAENNVRVEIEILEN